MTAAPGGPGGVGTPRQTPASLATGGYSAVVLALPGSPGGVRDGLSAVGGLLEHAAAMAAGGNHAPHGRPRTDDAAVTQPPSLVVYSVDPTDRIDYQPPRADLIRADPVTEALDRPGVLAAAARHRTGDLAIGDLGFVAAVSATHRGEAFAACVWLVDEAKARLPIWKHQHFADGTDKWVNSP